MTSGYSKTPLHKKLGIKTGFAILLYNVPKYYFNLFETWPEDVRICDMADSEEIDFIQFFCTRMVELETTFHDYLGKMKKNGLLWISWPKGSSKLETELNRESIRDYVLRHTGLVDVKVAAIDQDWSGLKFVYRLKNR